MPGILTLNITAQLVHGPISAQVFAIRGRQIVTNDLGRHSPIVSVGTSEEDMPVGDVGTEGILMVENLDEDNFVTWGPKSGGSMIPVGIIKPLEPAIIRLDPTATIRWIADTAPVLLSMYLLAD